MSETVLQDSVDTVPTSDDDDGGYSVTAVLLSW